MSLISKPVKKRKILVLAPFMSRGGMWICDFCSRPDLEFKKETYTKPLPPWHERGDTTPFVEWMQHFRYASRGIKWSPDCIVTCFPQLAIAAAALLLLMGKSQTKLIAWHFNLGSVSSRWKGRIAGKILNRVDRFIVHASGETKAYAEWLGVGQHKFRFVPLQRARFEKTKTSPIQKPYIVSMGSANRDYETLVEAIIGTNVKAVIISKKYVLDRLPDHPNLVKLSGLTQEDCNNILGEAEVSVIPIATDKTASGQVTLITSMRLGIPTIATCSVGTIDYIRDGETGMLVPPGDPQALQRAIKFLWQDKKAKSKIGSAARIFADEHFSDEAAGDCLGQAIDEVFAAQN